MRLKNEGLSLDCPLTVPHLLIIGTSSGVEIIREAKKFV